jgi:hypothetical protein
MENKKTVFGIIQGINEKDRIHLNGFIDDCLRIKAGIPSFSKEG